jgi:exosortase
MSYAATHPSVASQQSAASSQPIATTRWWIIASTILLLAYAPSLWTFFQQQWDKPHYQYFPFVIAAFGWLLWQRFHEGTPLTINSLQSHIVDGALLLVAGCLLIAAIMIHSPWCAVISLIVLMACVFRAISRTRRVTNLWGIWGLLLLIVPIPFNFDQSLTKILQLASSRVSSYVLDWFGIYHLMEGNTLWLQSKPLFVDEACSGIISMLSIVACAVVFAVVKNRTPLHMLLLAAAGIVWAAVMNVARISGIAVALEYWGIDWSAGASHEVLSLALFLMAFLALLSTDQVLLVCLAPVSKGRIGDRTHELQIGRWIARAWDAITAFGNPLREDIESSSRRAPVAPKLLEHRTFSVPFSIPWYVSLLFTVAAIGQTSVVIYTWNVLGPYWQVERRAEAVAAEDLPASLCGLSKVDFEAVERTQSASVGAHSRTFRYRAPDETTYTLSFDFAFVESWHELTICYHGNGWEMSERRVCPFVDEHTSENWGYVEADFSKPDGVAGALCFAEFDQFGTPFEGDLQWNAEPMSFWRWREGYLQPHRIYQVQVWVTAPNEVSDSQREKARELLLASRENLRSRITASSTWTAKASKDP